MTTHNVRDDLVENEIRSQTLRARMLETHRIDSDAAGAPLFVRREATEDDEVYQEGAGRYRKQQTEYALASWGADAKPVDYERHTCDAWPGSSSHIVHRRRPSRLGRLTLSFRTAVTVMMLAAAVLALLLFGMPAHSQNAPQPLVRSCPTLPTGSGFSACSNSTWSTPAPNLILDVLRSGVASDVWVTPNQLLATDRVFSCEDPSVLPGSFKSCPSLLPGQTDNWLKASNINFGTVVTPPPPMTNGTLNLSWIPPTQDSTGAAITQPLSYWVLVRSNSCATSGPACQPDYYGGTGPIGYRTPSADVAGVSSAKVSLAPGPWCAIVLAYFTGAVTTLGPPPDQEWCGTVGAGLVTPGKVTGLRAN